MNSENGVQPLISIVIPTHNRAKYALSCLKSLLSINDSRLEVVIHDTSNDENSSLKDYAASIVDERLVYVHTGQRLSMTENHEAAVSLATGEYTILIGDDDSVSNTAIRFAEYAMKNNIDVLVPKVKAVYSWPDFQTKFFGNAHAGKLYLDEFNQQIVKVDAQRELSRMLDNSCQGTDGMPKLYHGMVKTALLKKIKAKNGAVFFGVSPDVSASISLALLSNSIYEVDFPFTLPGASGGSNTGRSALNKHKGDLDSDEHIKPFLNLKWPEVIPRFFSVETVWAQAACETILSLQNKESNNLINDFNLNKLYALCIFKHRQYLKQIRGSYKAARAQSYQVSFLGVGYELIKYAVLFFFGKAKRLLNPSPSAGKTVLGTFDSVDQAVAALDECLNSKLLDIK